MTKLDSDKHLDCLEASDEIGRHDRNGKNSNRRFLDFFATKGRALNLDRRDTNRDRRIGLMPHFCRLSRRDIIDRRENLKDRRKDRWG